MSARFPDGPANFNAPFGLTWRHYWKLRSNPIEFATNLSRTYGDLVFFRIFWHRAYLVNHPDMIRQVLVAEAKNFPKCSKIQKHLRQITGNGLLVTEGETWRKQRLSTQQIFRSSRMDAFATIATKHTGRMLQRWSKIRDVQIEQEMTLLTQAIMGEAFFGQPLGFDDEIAEAVRVLSDVFHDQSRALFNLPDWFPTSYLREKKKSKKLLYSALEEVIQRRLASGDRRDDFLDMLLHSAPNQPCHHSHPDSANITDIMSQLLTMYVAGFHTTSVALAWLMFAVARHPKTQQRVRDEVQRVCGNSPPQAEHLNELQFAQMVVKESLRMYPASWELFARRSINESQLGGHTIPANSLVLIQPIVTHRDARFFPEPNKFDPLRFSKSREHEIPPFAWIPFGAGPHHCLGKSLALIQMSQILASIVQSFELKLDDKNAKHIRMVPKVSLRPATDIKVLIRPVSFAPSPTANLGSAF